ncbi:hypothetical protein [Pseudorhodoferax sp. Leaf265]|uniref:hypothetical protein n=1 Tax=Pseudorhodoferax sp. Leaf265 TaxID=1736315 RepID=UPI0006FE1F40|nr:hypothetical protein [Pseudorhodoferax sp. Leaf265]KQP12056.1 hypothetical protein ASF45_32130 [Pseudorhodoferax sp. Leaf265]
MAALYALVELADDYEAENGILCAQKNLRYAGTHRFVVLHDLGDPSQARAAPDIERHRKDSFTEDAVHALRMARSAIQMLALSGSQYEQKMAAQADGPVRSLQVPDHDWIRGGSEAP